jgi:hypothetical protein
MPSRQFPGVRLKIVTRLTHRFMALTLACAAAIAPAAQAAPQPSFGIEVGNALLCLNQLNSKYFFDYLVAAFGRPTRPKGAPTGSRPAMSRYGACRPPTS